MVGQRSLSFPFANLTSASLQAQAQAQTQSQNRTQTQTQTQPQAQLLPLPTSWNSLLAPGSWPRFDNSHLQQQHLPQRLPQRLPQHLLPHLSRPVPWTATAAAAAATTGPPPDSGILRLANTNNINTKATATRPSGRRQRQQPTPATIPAAGSVHIAAPVPAPAAPAAAPVPAPALRPPSSAPKPPPSSSTAVTATATAIPSPTSTSPASSRSSASESASSRDLSPRSKPKMPGRPAKRPADSGDDESPGSGNGNGSGPGAKVKLPRLERGTDDFSSVVKNRLQSYTRTGQACDRCKVRKIRCDALPEGCSHCLNQGIHCFVTDRVTGRTERRGYLQQVEREKDDMLTHIRDLERLLEAHGVEVKAWEWSPYPQYPPGVTFDGRGNPAQDPDSTDSWTQHGTVWVNNSSSTPAFARTLLESRQGEGHIGVRGDDSAPLSSFKGTQLSILGTTVDIAAFEAPDMDEPPADAHVSAPLYNKSTQAFLQSTMNRNPPLPADLPSRQDAFTWSGWYFGTISAFLPLLHQPTFFELLTRIYDEPGFQPSVAELVIVHMVFAIINFHYGVRNWQQADQRADLNDMSNKHYHYALSMFFELTCAPDLTAVQAMALICVHTRAFPKPGAASIVVNHALHRALELNLHRESRKPGEETNLNHELRKRAWWVILTIYVAINGRRGLPMPITVEEFDVGFPEPIADDLLSEDGVDRSQTMPCIFEVGINSFKIVPILMTMFSNIYSVRRDTKNYVNIVNALEAQIKNWDDELPGRLKLGHAEQDEHSRMSALYMRSFLLEFRLLLRHPSVGMTTNKKMMAQNTGICEDVAREMLQVQLEIQRLKCLDTTWYQLSLYAASIFSMLVAHWERRFETTPEAIVVLKSEMRSWLGILEETGCLLGSGPKVSTEIGQIIDRTIEWIEHDMMNKGRKPSLPTPASSTEVKQEQAQLSTYQVPEAPPSSTTPTNINNTAPAPAPAPEASNGTSQSDVPSKGFYQEPSMNGQTSYPPIAYDEQAQASIPSTTYEGETTMYFNPTPQVAAGAAAVSSVRDVSATQSNPLIAFAPQATQHVAAQPQADMLWQGSGNTWHDWASALADSQERYSATALLNLGGGVPRDSAVSGVPETAGLVTNNMNGVQPGASWPLMFFDNVAQNGS
ncbi:hypothetical protein EDB81DRAFT_685443 [Dactylonectria macrodidyma]|uniref:Zn(2)-C6 fungal-type domain-containing protein n=1 Tax=Dactylonectria macrodidyma TaxID=307937 RepID=A0A9P9F8P0_9HYPO|nr:hypothetical protein EDB81DRAFT_685443 [Dactylonectria macrodidyma]